MRSPTAALLWEIWRRNRIAVAVIVAATVAGRLLDYAEQPTDDPSSLIALLWMVSFLFLFGVFSYTEPSGTRGIGSFPRRLFTLPVSSLRLVALPVLTGIASVELLYLLWLGPLSRGGSSSTPFVAVLLGASMVFFQAVFWMLERLGPLRLVVAGAVTVLVYGVGLLPSWPPSPPPPWRSEAAVGAVVAALAVVVFLLAWSHIIRLRCGGGGRAPIDSSRSSRRLPVRCHDIERRLRRRRPLSSGSNGGVRVSCCQCWSAACSSPSSRRSRGSRGMTPAAAFGCCLVRSRRQSSSRFRSAWRSPGPGSGRRTCRCRHSSRSVP